MDVQLDYRESSEASAKADDTARGCPTYNRVINSSPIRLPLTTIPRNSREFHPHPCSSAIWSRLIKVRCVYWFLMRPISFGDQILSANPIAALSARAWQYRPISAFALTHALSCAPIRFMDVDTMGYWSSTGKSRYSIEQIANCTLYSYRIESLSITT